MTTNTSPGSLAAAAERARRKDESARLSADTNARLNAIQDARAWADRVFGAGLIPPDLWTADPADGGPSVTGYASIPIDERAGFRPEVEPAYTNVRLYHRGEHVFELDIPCPGFGCRGGRAGVTVATLAALGIYLDTLAGELNCDLPAGFTLCAGCKPKPFPLAPDVRIAAALERIADVLDTIQRDGLCIEDIHR